MTWRWIPLPAAACLGLAVLPAVAGSPPPGFDRDEALDTSQAAIGSVVSDYPFRDRRGQPFSIERLRGRPVVVSLVYTSCFHICPMLTEHLGKAVKVARESLGADSFSVVTIGFDTAVDTPERMREFAVKHQIDAAAWYFLSTDAQSIKALSRELGFIYRAAPKGFEHLTQTTILDGDLAVYRQIYGQKFPVPALVEPLKELVFHAPADASPLAGWLQGVLLFCTVYDPSSGRYRFDYSLFVGIFVGVLCLGTVAVFLVRAWRESV